MDPELLNELLAALEATPTGGNKQKMEFTVIDDRAELDKLRKMICEGVKDLKKQGIYPYSWDEESYGIMEARGPQAMNGDIYFCSAPHIIIPHMPKKFGSAAVEVGITLAYFELLCESKGLGCVYLGFPNERYETDAGCMGKTWYSRRSFCGNSHGIRLSEI